VLGPTDAARLSARWPSAEFIWFAPQAVPSSAED
jgi:hypothetical protein